MDRRRFLQQGSFAAFALAVADSSFASVLESSVFNIKMLTNTAGIFTERGGTIAFLLTEDGIAVIDAQFPETAVNCISEIKKKSGKPFALLINTHHHRDHSSGNTVFQPLVKDLIAHKNSKINQKAVVMKSTSSLPQFYPTITYTFNWQTILGKENITMHYFGAGHTNGDSYVWLKDQNVVHVGDLVFNRRHPVIDPSAGGKVYDWIENLREATDFFPADTKYVCGHAGEGYETVITKIDVLAFRSYLENVMKLTAEKYGDASAKAKFLRTTEIPGSSEWKGDGINRILEAAWEEYGKQEIMVGD